MNNVILIVRRELSSYLRTPSGYIIAAVVLLWEAVAFNAYAVSDQPRLSADVLFRFLEVAGGTTMVASVILSMRLLAEERANGTQVLLFTSPIREGEIVLGKYFSALAFLAVVILLSAYLPALIFVRGKVSYAHIAGGYAGLLFLGGTTLALGMLASSLVKHPFMAALLAAVFAALLEICWWVARVTEPPISEALANFSPFYKHFLSFRSGIVQLSDVVFFLSLIYLALLTSTRVLRSQRWR